MTQDTGTLPQTDSRTTRVLPAALRVTAGLLGLSNVGWKTPPDFGRSADGCFGLCRFVEEGSDVAARPASAAVFAAVGLFLLASPLASTADARR